MKIVSFTGEHRFLSNFYKAKVRYEGIVYPTAEHAFQAAKSTDRIVRLTVGNLPTPSEAKRYGRRKVTLRPNWDGIKVGIMRDVLRAKFSAPHLAKQLLETGDAELIEQNDWGDKYWGKVGNQGENWLGRVLMEIRQELAREAEGESWQS